MVPNQPISSKEITFEGNELIDSIKERIDKYFQQKAPAEEEAESTFLSEFEDKRHIDCVSQAVRREAERKGVADLPQYFWKNCPSLRAGCLGRIKAERHFEEFGFRGKRNEVVSQSGYWKFIQENKFLFSSDRGGCWKAYMMKGLPEKGSLVEEGKNGRKKVKLDSLAN